MSELEPKPLRSETEEEKRRHDEARMRRGQRLEQRKARQERRSGRP